MINLNAVINELDRKYRPRAKAVQQGRNRRVYIIGTYVIKVPLNLNGVTDNDWEGSVSNGPKPSEWDVIYPKHKRLAWYRGIPILFMEFVRPALTKHITKRLGSVPKWVDRVDCGQVGFNKQGRLMAYDYGPR